MRRKNPMSEEDGDQEIPLMVHTRMTRSSRVLSTEDDDKEQKKIRSLKSIYEEEEEKKKKKKKSMIRSLKSIYQEEEKKKKKKKNFMIRSLKSIYEEEEKKKKSMIRSLISIYEEEEKKKKNTLPISTTKENEEKKPIPVYELSFDYLKLYPDDEEESDEEKRERPDEDDFGGYKVVINQDEVTYTRVRHPLKVYRKSHERRGSCVLHDLNHPHVSTVSKKALDRYNAIEGTNYEYVGLVKAYKHAVDGFEYTLRFKARLPDQDPIYFQAMVWQRIPDHKNKVVVLDVNFVHPLP